MWKTKQMINNVMNTFDFQKVYDIMALTWWVWSMPERIWLPTTQDIREFVKKHLKETCEKAKLTGDDAWTACGWFEFEAIFVEWKVDEIEIKFVPVQNCAFREETI